jgi:hypothetical protein
LRHKQEAQWEQQQGATHQEIPPKTTVTAKEALTEEADPLKY